MQGNFSRQTQSTVHFFTVLICLFSFSQVIAQKQERLSYYNMEVLQKADGYFDIGNYSSALSNYQKVQKKFPGDTLVILKIAECYKLLNGFDESEEWYGRILNNDELPVDGLHKLNYAQVLTINGKYDEALYWYKEYYFSNQSDPRGIAGIRTIENLNKLYYDTMFYVVFPSNINTVYTEFSPVFYQDGIIFISDRPKGKVPDSDKGNKAGYTNWYYANLEENGSLSDPEKFNKKNMNTNFNEGPAVFYNNNRRMIFTQNSAMKETDSDNVVTFPVQLYSAFMDDKNAWSEISLLNFCNNKYSYAQPAITSDGKSLIFSSNMPGGFGGSDLYMSRFENNSWGEPVNLGQKFNTKGNEMFSYILNDSVLYFSSDGHGGLGGLDICYAPLYDTGQIVNIGFPVNSAGDDFGIIFDEEGMSGYFSSNRNGSKGKDDLFIFRIIRISLTLKIIDIKTSRPVSGAEVFSISGMDEKMIGKTDEEGFCKVILPVSKEIKIRMKKEDFESQVFTFEPMMYKTENTLVIHIDESQDLTKKTPEEKFTGITYKVQVMASRSPASPNQIKKKYKGSLPVHSSYEDNWHKYMIGEFGTLHEACDCLNSTRVPDAFVVAYMGNTRVNIVLARSKTNETDTCRTSPVK